MGATKKDMADIELIKELLEKDVDHIKTELEGISKHLEKLNEQVTKNTEFRLTAKGVIGLFGVISTLFGGVIASIMGKFWS